ncbi:UDP-N-acetylmuramoyl-tripeptide--D-alanyl-D-alanine ligase [bacterium]|nr:UDP-N-acetylmuramoyl-tripeptide--D-alanyl-D-alanine ligase [bacterium]
MKWIAGSVAAVLGAETPVGIAGDFCFSGICSDSRKILPGSLFLPLCGERFNGCDFAEEALKKGAAAVVWPRADAGERSLPEAAACRAFFVESSLKAHLALSQANLKASGARTAGITGSVGKTTTKDLLRSLLASKYKVKATLANHNSETGLAEMLMSLDPSYDIAIAEMGMRGFGQVAELAKIVSPEVSVITTIGESHLELLGSRRNIALAKAEILDWAAEDSAAVLPADSDFFELLCEHAKGRIVSFGINNEKADFRLLDTEVSKAFREAEEGVRRIVFGQKVRFASPSGEHTVFLPLPGLHNCANFLAAAAAAVCLGMSIPEIDAALAGCSLTEKRLQTEIFADGTVIIDDSYNAAPASVKAALRLLPELKDVCGRSIAVLGDMKELGENEKAMHAELGRACRECGVDILAAVGELSRCLMQSAEAEGIAAFWCADWQEAADKVSELMKPGDCILIKASHSMELDKTAEALRRVLKQN